MDSSLVVPAAIVGAYLLGSIPFAVVSSKLFGLADPRSYGSGNPGATNVLRSGNKKAALFTLLGDGAKGWLAVFLARQYLLPDAVIGLVAIAVFFSHLFPVFLKFKGGKGVATAAGVLLALDWQLGLAVIGVWAAAFAPFRISSLGSLTAFAVAPVLAWFWDPGYLWGVGAMSLLLILRHKKNIIALLRGEEKGFRKSAPPGDSDA